MFVLLDERLIEANCLVAGHRLRRHPAFLIGRRAPRCPFTGSAGLLGASAYWERQPTGSAGLLGAPAFQPASPDAGSMPASGDLAVGTTWRVLSRMFISDGSGPGLKSFAISYVFGTALSRAKAEPARKPALPVRRAKHEPARKPALPVRCAKDELRCAQELVLRVTLSFHMLAVALWPSRQTRWPHARRRAAHDRMA